MIANPAMDFTVSVVRHALDTETTEESFRSVIGDIIRGWWKTEVEQVRSAFASGGKSAADGPKKKLPAVLFSGTFTRRAADALKQHSGLICVDLDNLGDRLPSIRESIEADPHTLTAFVSPTGSGLKVVFRCSAEKPHQASYRAAERYCLQVFGLEVDPACKDVSRLCFVSHDPETFINENAIPLPELEEAKEFTPPVAEKTVARPLSGVEPWDDYDQRVDFPNFLRSHGWKEAGRYGWTRPGKESGLSATWNKVPGRFFVFSSSTALEANHTYRPWHVFAILEHGGNWSQAVAALRKAGYGAQQPSRHAPKAANGATEVYDPGYEEPVTGSETPIDPAIDQPKPESPEEKRAKALAELKNRLQSRAFNFAIIPPKPVPRFMINGQSVCTPGNITTLIAQSKSGKSSLQEAMIAAVISADLGTSEQTDCLGFTAMGPKGKHVVHFDTEQSIYDHDMLIRRALRRAQADVCPPWLHSYCLTGFAIPECRRLVRLVLDDLATQGGTFAFLIDGVADLAVNVNDPEECNPLVAELHEAAILFDCSIICNIHENPGQDFGKGRGHLGSQLERKAESNLRLKKTGDIITVFSEKMRRGSIMEKDGPKFSWNNEAMMHLSCESVMSEKDQAKRDRTRDCVEDAFHHTKSERLRFAELLKAISAVASVGPSAAEDRFTLAKKFGLIQKDMLGFWTMIR